MVSDNDEETSLCDDNDDGNGGNDRDGKSSTEWQFVIFEHGNGELGSKWH